MSPELADLRERLIQRFERIPDHPPPEKRDEYVRQAEALVHLIGWIDTHPESSRREYLVEMRRVSGEGAA